MKVTRLSIYLIVLLTFITGNSVYASVIEYQDFENGMGSWYANNVRTATHSISSEFNYGSGSMSFKAGTSSCTGSCYTGSSYDNEQAVILNFNVNSFVQDFSFQVLEHSYGSPDSVGWGERGWVEIDGVKLSGGNIYPTALDQWFDYSFSLNQHVNTLTIFLGDITYRGAMFVDDVSISTTSVPEPKSILLFVFWLFLFSLTRSKDERQLDKIGV